MRRVPEPQVGLHELLLKVMVTLSLQALIQDQVHQ